jgi:hypothetical protein
MHEEKEKKRPTEDTATAGRFVVLALAFLGYCAWLVADASGWIPHRVDSAITAQENWFVGETKECISDPLDEQTAKAVNKSVGSVVEHINCDDGPEHKVRIMFWGQKKQKDIAWATWSCTRESSSFTCKQTGTAKKQ